MVVDDVGDLVRAAVLDEPGAWDRLVERFGRVIWTVARSHGLTPTDAADVSQITWLRLAEHLEQIREPERLGAWLVTTARNESLRVLRCARRQVPFDPSWGFGEDDDGQVELELLEHERDTALWRAFRSLPGRCQLLLRVLFVEPAKTYAEVSDVLDMPIGSIGPSRNRCLEHLRRCAELDAPVAGASGAHQPRAAP